jgi:hypothetical protein
VGPSLIADVIGIWIEGDSDPVRIDAPRAPKTKTSKTV